MLHLLHNKHKGKSASIIASGPTAIKYDESTDISIAVNGAAFMEKQFDYFLCGDHNSHNFSWFKIQCSTVRVVSRLVASMDSQLYPKDFDEILDRKAVPAHKQRQVGNLLCPIYPHVLFNYRWYKEGRLKPNSNFLMFGGTISCCAVQLAFLLGCSEIHLYGCGFNHRRGHYFYKSGEKPGRVVKTQFETMERCLKEVRSLGMKVYIHGKSKLTQCDKKIK
jgi:hypothetical protein